MENNNLDWQVNRALNSLDGMERAKANPFLYTRVKAAIDEQSSAWYKLAGIFTKPAYAFTIIAAFLALNLCFVAYNRQQETTAKEVAEGEQAFASELATVNYNLTEFNTNDK